MPRSKFETFEIPSDLVEDPEEGLNIPVDAKTLRSLTSGVLKKDVLIISIRSSDVTQLSIEIQNTAKERRTEGKLKLIDEATLPAERLTPVAPVEYDLNKPNAVIPAQEFQKACKAGTSLKAGVVRIRGQEKGIAIDVATALITKCFPFGAFDDDVKPIYNCEFPVKNNIGAIPKCCGMTTNVRIYCRQGQPILFRFDAGQSGTFDVYLVPKH